MDNLFSTIDGIIGTLTKKYGFEIESAEYHSDINLDYNKEKSQDDSEENTNPSIDIPNSKGKRIGDLVGVGKNIIYWNGKAWLPQDIFNASLPPEKQLRLKPLTGPDKSSLMGFMANLEGSLDIGSLVKGLESDFTTYFKNLSENKDTSEIKQSMDKRIQNFKSKNSTALKNREKVIKDVEKTLGKDIGKAVKRVVLRTITPEAAKGKFEGEIKDKKEEYTPKLDDNKNTFTNEDRDYIAKTIENKGAPLVGPKTLWKALKGKYSEERMEELQKASEHFGGVPGVYKYLKNYSKLKPELAKKYRSPKKHKLKIIEISSQIKPIDDYLDKIYKDHPKLFKDSIFSYTDKVLDTLKSYERSGARFPLYEKEFLKTMRDSGNVLKHWRKLRIPKITKQINDLPNLVEGIFQTKFEESKEEQVTRERKEKQNKDQLKGTPKFYDDLVKLRKNPIELDDEEAKEIRTLLRAESSQKIKDILDKGKTKYQEKIDRKKYKKEKKIVDEEEVNKFLNEKDIKEKEYLNKRIEKNKEDIKNLKKDIKDESSVKYIEQLEKKLETLQLLKKDNQKQLKEMSNMTDWVKKNKREVKEKQLEKEIKRRKDAPEIDVREREKEFNDKFMNFLEKTLTSPKKSGGHIKLKDMSDEEAKKRIEIFNKHLRTYEHDEDRVLNSITDPLAYIKWRNKNKSKKSNYIISSYTNSIFYKLEKLASLSTDSFVEAELIDIQEKLKNVI